MKTATIVSVPEQSISYSMHPGMIRNPSHYTVVNAVKRVQREKSLQQKIIDEMRVDSGKFNSIRGLDKLAR